MNSHLILLKVSFINNLKHINTSKKSLKKNKEELMLQKQKSNPEKTFSSQEQHDCEPAKKLATNLNYQLIMILSGKTGFFEGKALELIPAVLQYLMPLRAKPKEGYSSKKTNQMRYSLLSKRTDLLRVSQSKDIQNKDISDEGYF